MTDMDINRVHERIDKLSESVTRYVERSHESETELRSHIGNLTTDVALLHEHLKNEVKIREGVLRPCPDHKELARTVDDHLKSEAQRDADSKQQKRLWDSGKVRVVSSIVSWLLQVTLIGAALHWIKRIGGE